MKARLHHIGLALNDLQQVLSCLSCLDLNLCTNEQSDPTQKVTALFLQLIPGHDVHLEFLKPDQADSPISSFLDKRGGGLHHLCLEVDDLPEACRRLERQGHTMVCPPVNCQGMDLSFPWRAGKGSQVAFFLCGGLLLLELLNGAEL